MSLWIHFRIDSHFGDIRIWWYLMTPIHCVSLIQMLLRRPQSVCRNYDVVPWPSVSCLIDIMFIVHDSVESGTATIESLSPRWFTHSVVRHKCQWEDLIICSYWYYYTQNSRGITFNICSYNCEGFKTSLGALEKLCSDHDILMLLETWLYLHMMMNYSYWIMCIVNLTAQVRLRWTFNQTL